MERNLNRRPEFKRKEIVQKGFGTGITLLRDYQETKEILVVILE